MVVLGLLFGLVGTDVNSGSDALHLRHPGAGRGRQLRGAGDGHVRHRRGRLQPRAARPGPPGVHLAARPRAAEPGRSQHAARGRSCAAPRSARSSASCRAAARCWRRLPPTRSRRRWRSRRANFGNGDIRGVAAPEVRQQRRRADLVHPDADARRAVEPDHGADDRRADHPGHPARPGGDDATPGAVLGHHRVDVDRQPVPAGAEPADDRALGEAARGAVPAAVPGHPDVLLHRRVHDQQQRVRPFPARGLLRRSAICCSSSAASPRRWCSASCSAR